MSGQSFVSGEGQWLGASEVYDASGVFAGLGRDSRAVRRRVDERTVEVEVSFDGPFKLSGRYVIEDRGDHRLYLGPLNHGYAEALGDGLIDAHNYWPDLGLSQRFFLMVLPGGDTQLSLALLCRGEYLTYAVVGEYARVEAPDEATTPPNTDHTDDAAAAERDGNAARGAVLLDRAGTWTGELTVLGADGSEAGEAQSCELVEIAPGDDCLEVTLAGGGFVDKARFRYRSDGRSRWTTVGDAAGSESLWGGRAVSGNLLFKEARLRLRRREVVCRDGSRKGVLHTWYRGGERVGTAYGVLDFKPAG